MEREISPFCKLYRKKLVMSLLQMQTIDKIKKLSDDQVREVFYFIKKYDDNEFEKSNKISAYNKLIELTHSSKYDKNLENIDYKKEYRNWLLEKYS